MPKTIVILSAIDQGLRDYHAARKRADAVKADMFGLEDKFHAAGKSLIYLADDMNTKSKQAEAQLLFIRSRRRQLLNTCHDLSVLTRLTPKHQYPSFDNRVLESFFQQCEKIKVETWGTVEMYGSVVPGLPFTDKKFMKTAIGRVWQFHIHKKFNEWKTQPDRKERYKEIGDLYHALKAELVVSLRIDQLITVAAAITLPRQYSTTLIGKLPVEIVCRLNKYL